MRSSLFAYGFRAQFLLAGCAALLLVPVWASNFALGTPLGSSWPPTLWHAHEMLFGFIGSAIAGFLLTAVPSWTGERGFAGRPLMLLAGIWLAARLLIASSAVWPAVLVAAVDLCFLPVLAVLVGLPLLRTRSRNRFLLLVLALLWLCDLVFHVALLRANPPLALHALQVGIDLVLLMVTVVGGRIVPAFTTAALRPLGASAAVRDRGVLTVLAVSSMVLVTLTDVFAAPAALGGWIAAVAALLQAARLLQWAAWRTLRLPIVWVLHLGYAWLPVGLGPQGPGAPVGCSAGGVLAACADRGCTDDHDRCGDVPRHARTYRPCPGGAPVDHACVFAAHWRRADPRLRPGRVPPELRFGHRAGSVVLVRRLRALPWGVCTDTVAATGGRQARVSVTRDGQCAFDAGCSALIRGRRVSASTSASQQRADAVQLAMRHAQALPELQATGPAAREHPELLDARREQLCTMLGSRLGAVSRMAQSADLHLPRAGSFEHFDPYFHRRTPLITAHFEGVGRRGAGRQLSLLPDGRSPPARCDSC